MNVFAVRAEVDDRVADHLSEAVISHFAAAIRFKQRHVSLFKLVFVQENRRALAATADGERVRMFEQKQRVGLRAGFYGLFDLFLECEGRLVIHEPQSLDQKLSFYHSCNQAVDFVRHSNSRVGIWYNPVIPV